MVETHTITWQEKDMETDQTSANRDSEKFPFKRQG